MKERDLEEEGIENVETVVSYDSNSIKRIWWGSVMPVIRDSYYLIIDNILLFTGVVLTSSSILNFDYGRYCDGMRSDNYACVNSATIYEYSRSTIFLFVLGCIFITFWYLQRNTPATYEE